MKHLFSFLGCITIFLGFSLYADVEESFVLSLGFGGIKNDYFEDAVATFDGNYAFCGITESFKKKNRDAYFCIISPTGQLISEKNIGSSGNESANALIRTRDGGFVLVGSSYIPSDSYDDGKLDGWIVKLDYKGDTQWIIHCDTREESQLLDIIELPNGNYVAVGERSNKGYAVYFNAFGSITNEQPLPTLAIADKVTSSDTAYFLIAGKSIERKNPTLLKIDYESQYIFWSKALDELQIDGINDLKFEDNEVYILASKYSRKKGTQVCFAKLDEEGNKMFSREFGGNGSDVGNSFAFNTLGEVLICGNSNSHFPGSRNDQIFLHKFNQEGEPIWKNMKYFGSKADEKGNALIQGNNNEIIIGGQIEKVRNATTDALFLKIYDLATLPISKNKILESDIVIQGIQLIDTNDTLSRDENSYVELEIYNAGNQIYNGLNLNVGIVEESGKSLLFSQSKIQSLKPKRVTKVYFPIAITKNISQDITLDFKVFNDLNLLAESQLASIFETEFVPKFSLKELSSSIDKKMLGRADTISFELLITNSGNLSAESTVANFVLPFNSKALSAKEIQIGKLPVDSSVKVVFQFMVNKTYPLDTLPLKLIVWDTEQDAITSQYRIFNLDNFYSFGQKQKSRSKVEIVNPPKKKTPKGGKQSVMDELLIDEYLTWAAPDHFEYSNNEMPYSLDSLFIKTHVRIQDTVNILGLEHFYTSVKGKKIENNQSINAPISFKKEVMASVQQQVENQTVLYEYINTIELDRGLNRIYVKLDHPNYTGKTPYIDVNYQMPYETLHLYSFGIPFKDLDYTTNDAKDFAKAFTDQEGKIFKTINTNIFNRASLTTKQKIDDTIETIVQQSKNKDIEAEDLVVIYISSHGYSDLTNSKDKFYVACSDFNVKIPNARSLDFETDIIEKIVQLPSRFILIIDACQSDSDTSKELESGQVKASTVLNEILQKINDPRLYSISSCSKNELSYEHKTWENGCFTEAVLEAFSGDDITDKCESNDGVIFLDGLFNYAKERVPELIKNAKIKGKQTPEAYINLEISTPPLFDKTN